MIEKSFWKKIFLNPGFIIIASVKLITGSLLGSDYLIKGFIPFVNYFVTTGGSNPYDYFVQLGHSGAFPYPPLMLWGLATIRFIASPLLSHDWSVVTFGHLFINRLPIFFADVLIYAVLCRWLETKERQVLWLYWASPILFFINYIHGQLDVIPMAILFASLVMLFNRRPWHAALLLGIGIATKTHLIAVLPFYFIYWQVNKYSWKKTIGYVLASLAVFVLCIAPYLQSPGFMTSVFGTTEAGKVYLVNLSYQFDNLQLLLAPAAIVLLFLNFLAYKKLNKDAFLLILSLLFSVFIILVPPMPGWFYWSIPFIIYFFAKYKETPQASFWLMNLAYLGYIVFSQDSTLFSSVQLLAPQLANQPNLYTQLTAAGVHTTLLVDAIFTTLVAAITMNAIWVYRIGVRSNLEYTTDHSPVVIGIGGDSGAGKNTLVKVLLNLFGTDSTTTIEGDDAHKWERNDAHWQQHTHLDPKSNRLHDELVQTLGLKDGQNIQRTMYDHGTGQFSSANTVEGKHNIIYVGLHPFYLSKMRQLFSLKIYVEPDEALRRHWKIIRDTTERGHTKAEILAQIEQREADANTYIRPQRQFADLIISYTPIEPLVDDKYPAVQLSLTCDNSLPIDPLMEALTAITSLKTEHWYDSDLHHQTVQCSGTIDADQIRTVAYQLVPNLDELLQHSPMWNRDYEGIIQLFTVYYHSESKKTA